MSPRMQSAISESGYFVMALLSRVILSCHKDAVFQVAAESNNTHTTPAVVSSLFAPAESMVDSAADRMKSNPTEGKYKYLSACVPMPNGINCRTGAKVITKNKAPNTALRLFLYLVSITAAIRQSAASETMPAAAEMFPALNG